MKYRPKQSHHQIVSISNYLALLKYFEKDSATNSLRKSKLGCVHKYEAWYWVLEIVFSINKIQNDKQLGWRNA